MTKLTTTITTILCHLITPLFVVSSSASFNDNNGGLLLSTSIINNNNNNNNLLEFDYFVLALQWPPTCCSNNTFNCCNSNACCRRSGPPQQFTIHGLWSNYNDGSWPSCCGSTSFDEKEISTLHKALDEYWPTLSCGTMPTCNGRNGSFYAHEWEKHGTCSASVTPDGYNYFLTTLNIYFKYNVTDVLSEAGYTPSNTEKYPLGSITTSIENAFHTSPLIVCSGDAIQEIRLCFYKDFKVRDCLLTSRIENVVDSSLSSCPRYVSLPAFVSSGSRDDQTAYQQHAMHSTTLLLFFARKFNYQTWVNNIQIRILSSAVQIGYGLGLVLLYWPMDKRVSKFFCDPRFLLQFGRVKLKWTDRSMIS